jgi:signal transduction histidine kinase
MVGDTNFGRIDPQSWKTSIDVMNTRKQVIVEEEYEGRSYLSVKAPLIINDKVEGVIGLAIDMTNQKKAEELEIQNKLQAIKIINQKNFSAFISRIAHDIISPLVSLRSVVNSCKDLPEKQHSILRNAISGINSIADTLLEKYKEDQKNEYSERGQLILVHLALLEAVNQKIYQYQGKQIKFKYDFDPDLVFAFVKCDPLNFGRMISNLINNAVDALENKAETVEINLSTKDQTVKICVKDNGNGMPAHVIEKIVNRLPVGTTKSGGHGIGLGQVYNTLELYNGTISVESEKEAGTAITITFPLAERPNWIADELVFRKGDTIVILDDDESAHHMWENLLRDYSENLTLEFFTDGRKAIDFIDSSDRKEKMFLLADYDLRGDTTGLQVILESGMKEHSIIVTSIYNDGIMQDLVESSVLKILPKQLLDYVPVSLKNITERKAMAG